MVLGMDKPRYAMLRLKCQVCGREWSPASLTPPRRCPNHQCRSVRWHVPKKKGRAA